jgi:hypothetical protein
MPDRAQGCAIRQTHDFFSSLLEHDPEKWMPVFGKDHAQNKKPRL